MSTTGRALPAEPGEHPDPAAPVELVDRVAAAVAATPGVHDLHTGVLGEVATYLPGRRVAGVRLLEPGCEVHLVVTRDAVVAEVSAAVRSRLVALTGAPVDVYVEDVRDAPTTRG